jgi:hypothetical protein
LSNNSLQNEDLVSIANLLKHNATVKKIDLSGNPNLSPEKIKKIFGPILKDQNCKIENFILLSGDEPCYDDEKSQSQNELSYIILKRIHDAKRPKPANVVNSDGSQLGDRENAL